MSQKKYYPRNKCQVWELKLIREGQRVFVKNLGNSGALNVWKERPSTMDVMVRGSKAAQVAGVLHEREIPFSVAIGDVELLVAKETANEHVKTPIVNIVKHLDWKSYHRLDTIYEFLDNLTIYYPFLCTVKVIGTSAEGREIKMLKISNGNAGNAGIWLDGSIHPREWVSVSVVTYIANYIVKQYYSLPEYATDKDWYIVPVLNPDGYEYTHTHDRMWRKNRAKYDECIGVDLNRNFSFGWGTMGEEGSSEDPGSIFYRGPEPFSEPETQAVRDTILNSEVNFKVFLSFHSYGEVVLFPWGHSMDPCPDYVELLEGGTAIAKAIHKCTGHTYRVGSTKDLMYYSSGTSTDWAYAIAKIPYCYMLELRAKKYRFLLPKEEILPTCQESLNGVMALIKFSEKSREQSNKLKSLKKYNISENE